MEMVPMRAQATAGQVVNFVCAYFSMERLEIDIQPIGHNAVDGKMLAASGQHSVTKALVLGPPVRDVLDRFPWGSRRTLSLLIDTGHRQVKCRVTDTDGLILGELTALIQPAGSLSITRIYTNKKHLLFFFNFFLVSMAQNTKQKSTNETVRRSIRPSQTDNVALFLFSVRFSSISLSRLRFTTRSTRR